MRMRKTNYNQKALKTYEGLRLQLIGNVLLFFFLLPYILLLIGEYSEAVVYIYQLLGGSHQTLCLLLPISMIISLLGSFHVHEGKVEFPEKHALYLRYSLGFAVIGTVTLFVSVLSLFAAFTESWTSQEVVVLAFMVAIPLWKAGKCFLLYNLEGWLGKQLLHISFALSLIFSVWLGFMTFVKNNLFEHTAIGYVLTIFFLYFGSYFSYLAALIMALRSIKSGEVKAGFSELEKEIWVYRAHSEDNERSLHRYYQLYQPGQGGQETNDAYRLRFGDENLEKETPWKYMDQAPGSGQTKPVRVPQDSPTRVLSFQRPEEMEKVEQTEQKGKQQGPGSDLSKYWKD